ncbi:MAG: hypothetical protein J1E40_05625 [Oscillospiraceae bacterium]|nr:hypothetical protein [Oscillospiraceae bacterium]
MGLFKKKCDFGKSLSILAKQGFTDEYADMLKTEISAAERPKDIAKGKSFLANALLIRGRLKEAFSVFEEIDMKRLEWHLKGNLVSNMIFCKFVQDDFKTAEALYKDYNDVVLGEPTDAMKRSLAIHEHINGRYEVSVEIYVKMLNSECRFLDICMVKSLLRLDMFERAKEFTGGFERYDDCWELTAEVRKLKNKISDGLPKKKK